MSLVHSKVYSIPALLLIGWRGLKKKKIKKITLIILGNQGKKITNGQKLKGKAHKACSLKWG